MLNPLHVIDDMHEAIYRPEMIDARIIRHLISGWLVFVIKELQIE